MSVPTELEDLRTLYRAAFDEWATQVRHLGSVRDSGPEGSVLAAAKFSATSAETHYREVRNRLSEEMVIGATSVEAPSEEILKTKIRLEQMDERSLNEFREMCDQFCAAAVRRGEQPPSFFARRKQLALEEVSRRARLVTE